MTLVQFWAHQRPKNVFVGELCGVYCKQGVKELWSRHRDRKFNTLRPRKNGRHFADGIFERICLNENASILIKISLKIVSKGPINNIPALVQTMCQVIISSNDG